METQRERESERERKREREGEREGEREILEKLKTILNNKELGEASYP